MATTMIDLPVKSRTETSEEAQFAVLREALQQCWDDIEAGRYITIEPDRIGEFVKAVGRRAAERVRRQHLANASS